MSTKLRIVFMGTPDFAVSSLKALVECGKYEIVGVVTQPDRPQGRGKKLAQSAVKTYATSQGLIVLQPERVRRAENVSAIAELKPDLIVVAAFGQILPKEILDMPRYGCINVHASLLPRYRGAAPIHYALMHGEEETGVTIMQMDVGMDTGAMLRSVKVPIEPYLNQGELHDRLKVKGAELLLTVIDDLVAGKIVPVPQVEAEATYAPLLKREIELIDWNDTSLHIHDKVRALSPKPGAYTTFPDGRKLKILCTGILERKGQQAPVGTIVGIGTIAFSVACGEGTVLVFTVQPESRKVIEVKDFVHGNWIHKGDVLGVAKKEE